MKSSHAMNLQKKYFDLIAGKKKTIELRLNDDKRKLINVGDNIEFNCGKSFIRVKVTNIKVYNTFLKALKNSTLKKTLPNISTYKEGVETYHNIKSYKENETKYGVVAIEFKLF